MAVPGRAGLTTFWKDHQVESGAFGVSAFSGQWAPWLIHDRSTAMSAAASGLAGGIANLVFRSTASMSLLAAACPGTMTAPWEPPLSAVSRELRSKEDIAIAFEWH